MPAAFPKIPRIEYEGSRFQKRLRLQALQPRRNRRGQVDEGAPSFLRCVRHTMRGAGADMFGWGTAVRPWELGEGSVEAARKRVRCSSSSSKKLTRRSTRSMTASRSTRQNAARIEPQFGRGGEGHEGGTTAHRHQTVVGHGATVCPPTIPSRRGDELQRRRVCLRRGPGEEGARSHPRRRRLRVLGSARVTRRC